MGVNVTLLGSPFIPPLLGVVVKSGLNFDDIRSLEILDAPAELQRKFTAIWKKVQKHKVRLIEFSLLSDLNFRALSSSAFRGDL